MIKFWAMGCWVATLLPMAALTAWVIAARPRRNDTLRSIDGIGLALIALAGILILMVLPHEDRFTGLDNMTYRHMAESFAGGRGFHDRDRVLAAVPTPLREAFLYHRGPVGRPTRDRTFQLAGWQSVETEPFFMPTLPLAAAAQAPGLAPERFVPLVAAFWLVLILVAAHRAGGRGALVAVPVLVLGTAWPAYFLRGFYAEAVGAMMISSVVTAAAVRPLRGSIRILAGFLLGFSLSYHPTLIVLAVPVGLVLMLESRANRHAAGMAAGILAGFLPLWIMTRWVCSPYGDWTRWTTLRSMLFRSPEHQAVALVLVVLILASSLAAVIGWRTAVRSRMRRLEQTATPWGWLALCLLPGLLIALLPGLPGDILRRGATATWSGIRWPYAAWSLLGLLCILRRHRPPRERLWLATLCWSALLFIFIKGVETPVGLWSQRRFLPVIIMGIGLLAAPMAAAITNAGRRRQLLMLAVAVTAGGANLLRWPAAYLGVNERGASEWIAAMADTLGTERRIIFDYYPHSIPYAVDLDYQVLGLGEPSRHHWPEVADWIAATAGDEPTWLITSWEPTALEDGLRLEPVFSKSGQFPTVHAAAFFPVIDGVRTVQHHGMRAVPLQPGDSAAQSKSLSGSPIGLRGPWGRRIGPATWTRQDSGIIGPVPAPGATVRVIIECEWSPPPSTAWPVQSLTVTPPWGGDPLRLTATTGVGTISGSLPRPPDDPEQRAATGIYRFHSDTPYDPAAFGLRGYDTDLGVLIHHINLRIYNRETDATNR